MNSTKEIIETTFKSGVLESWDTVFKGVRDLTDYQTHTVIGKVVTVGIREDAYSGYSDPNKNNLMETFDVIDEGAGSSSYVGFVPGMPVSVAPKRVEPLCGAFRDTERNRLIGFVNGVRVYGSVQKRQAQKGEK